jgi:ubiquinone/menaquinone biosynthesis C-methylase UbiE
MKLIQTIYLKLWDIALDYPTINQKTQNIYETIVNDYSNIEEQRQMIQHLLLYKVCDEKIFLSPINKNIEYGNNLILNLGSGYSTWTNHFEELYKNVFIYDIDINKNLYPYLLIDLKKDKIIFKDNTIYFVYQRDMITVYENNEWIHIINEIYRVLKKDGYAEFVEYNIYVNSNQKTNCYSNMINKYLMKIFNKNNIEDICDNIKNIFSNIKIHKKILPLYNEDIFQGKCIENLIMGYNHFNSDLSYVIKEKYNITFTEYIDLLKNEWENNKSYMEVYIIIVQK